MTRSSPNDRPGTGIGASVLRNEDGRFLHGRGQYLADLDIAGVRDVAFLRSPVASARISAIEIDPADRDRVFTLGDLGAVKPVRAVLRDEAFRPSDYPVLAGDHVRFVGEPIAMCIGANRAFAEDLAQAVFVDFDETPAVTDLLAALDDDAPRVHSHWPDNVAYVHRLDNGDLDAARRDAAVVVEQRCRMNRQSVVSLEGRAVLAYWDHRQNELVVYSSTQFPHVIRTILADLLGLEERKLRVVAVDVGGGFGVKNNLQQEEVAIAALALRVPYPVRWIEDRREHLIASPQAREHDYDIRAYADAQGRILGIESRVVVDAGAYSIWPWSSAMEGNMANGMVPGPYNVPAYSGRGITVASNKPPLGPYRGVGRPGACFAIERTIDEIARAVGRDPYDVRMENLIRPEQMPFQSIVGRFYDSGDYPESLRRAAELIGREQIRLEQQTPMADGRLLGLGFAVYVEQTAHGTQEWLSRKLTEVYGYEAATLKFMPDGGLVIEAAVQNHGQGLETSLAQVAASELGVDPRKVTVRHGDTAVSPYGMGTFASRSMVMSGGAVGVVARQMADKIRRIGAFMLEVDATLVELRDDAAWAGERSVPLARITRAALQHPEELPPGEEPGLEISGTYQPEISTGAFSYATHAVKLAVDTGTGQVELLDYVVVHDCGTIVNPMIVEGQIVGGVAQGIGTALLEEVPFDGNGQPLASTFMDYIVPGPVEVPDVRVDHLVHPSPYTRYGIKGMGEGGAIGAPAAVLNGINDALRPLGVSVNETPMTPARLLAAIVAQREAAR